MNTHRMDEIDRLRREVQRCSRCGKCKSACPVFELAPDEAGASRGKIALTDAFLSDRLQPSRRLREILRDCLLCTRCRDVCPSGVEYVHLLHVMRSLTDRRFSRTAFAGLAMRVLLPARALLDASLRAAWRLQRTTDHTPLRHLPLFVMGSTPIPELAPRTALREYAAVRRLARPKGRIAFFTGCLINYVYPRIAGAFIRLAERAGYEVVLPGDQLCCGTPALSLGQIPLARRLAERNVAALSAADCDIVVTACASCARTLRREYPDLLGPRASFLDKRVLMASQFLLDVLDKPPRRNEKNVTYHDPCHLYYGLGIHREPRRLLERYARFVDSGAPPDCCGFGGTFAAFFPDRARQIGDTRIRELSRTGADVVASSCPGCMLQLNACARAAGLPVEVKHLIEVVDEAYLTP